MAHAVDYYPSSPAEIPSQLTKPSAGYRVRVIVVLTSLILFVLLYIGLVVGSAYLCYSSFAALGSPPPKTSSFWLQWNSIVHVDARVLRTYNDAAQRLQRRELDDAAFLQILERDVLPPWQAERKHLAEINDVPAEAARDYQQLGRYMQLCEECWLLDCQAHRQRDQRLVEEANQKWQQAEELAKQGFSGPARPNSRSSSGKGDSTFWMVIVGLASGVLCLFLVKGFFKWQRVDKTQRVEVTEKEQPVLFAFLRQLCRDTAAPLPHRVYLTAEVNAAVFYHESLLSLVLPTPKNLVIGLGLVNRLNLSEFKAVLAHEFGHFSQNSMKLGSYVYRSNRIIGDLVFGRDWLDDAVAALCRTDFRIAIFAWAFAGTLWVLRQTLAGLFRVMNFANSALLRQMEYNADLVAVSVTGSDALVHSLARLDFAADTLVQAWSDLTAAADHHLYSRDLFYHQTRAADYLRALRREPRLGEPPPLPEDPRQMVQVFQTEDISVPRMWATHPTNHDREANAKRQYIRSTLDERSPWFLFHNASALREDITRQLYQVTRPLEQLKLEPAEVVQVFIDNEHAETIYHPRYHGLYDHRYLTPGDVDELLRADLAEFADEGQLTQAQAQLYSGALQARMEAHGVRQQEYGRLARMASGEVELTGKDFAFRGARYRAAEALKLLDQVQKELDGDFSWMGSLDRQVFLVHFAMARQVGDQVRRELEERYRFHLTLQAIHGQLLFHHQQVSATLGQLAGKRQLEQEEFQWALAVLREAYSTLRDKLQAAGGLHLPVLKNMTPGEPLGPFLLSQPLVVQLGNNQQSLDGNWIAKLLEQFVEVLDKCRRILSKSQGGILALQETIAERWTVVKAVPVLAGGLAIPLPGAGDKLP
jgi:Zn-dependent protease with chaperone function